MSWSWVESLLPVVRAIYYCCMLRGTENKQELSGIWTGRFRTLWQMRIWGLNRVDDVLVLTIMLLISRLKIQYNTNAHLENTHNNIYLSSSFEENLLWRTSTYSYLYESSGMRNNWRSNIDSFPLKVKGSYYILSAPFCIFFHPRWDIKKGNKCKKERNWKRKYLWRNESRAEKS